MRSYHGILAALALVLGCGARTAMEIDPPLPDAAVPDAPPLDAPDAPAPVVCRRVLTVEMLPSARLQLAVWIESDDGDFATIALTDATARRGLGNRPGALQMASGYRWPVGRRENVLPGWASARLASGAPPFPRVVFTDRREGFLSGATSTSPGTRDDYYCLSFSVELSRRDGLDAVSCASVLQMDKGRYITDADLAVGYAEPGEDPAGVGAMRLLSRTSAYPPRRDVTPRDADHADVGRFAADALAAMPELDAVTRATPAGETPLVITWDVPASWPARAATVSIEANSEGDYGGGHDAARYPTPSLPTDEWDYYSQAWGYPYRGQPSVVFDVAVSIPITEPGASDEASALLPTRMGSLDDSLATLPIDDTIVNDAIGAPGSGVDRLHVRPDGQRIEVRVDVVCE